MANDTIQGELRSQLTDAMKSGDSLRRDVIRQIETELSRAKADPGCSGVVDDELYLQVIGGYVKRMSKARGEFVDAGERGTAHAERLSAEIDYLSRWLPQTAGREETLDLVRRAVAEVTAAEPDTPPAKLTGRVIGMVMRSGEGVDGSLVQELVRQELGA